MKLRLLISVFAVSVSALTAQVATFSIVYEGTLTNDQNTGTFAAKGWSAGITFRSVGVFVAATGPISTSTSATTGSTAAYLTSATPAKLAPILPLWAKPV